MRVKMIKLIGLTVFNNIIDSCSTTKGVSTSERDGETYETAIIVRSVKAEYEWLKNNYPGYRRKSQALRDYKRKPYDVMTIITTSGETKKVYFDISRFYGF